MKTLTIIQPIRNALKHLALAAVLAAGLGASAAHATTATVSGAWDDTATWGGSAVPTSTDPVMINSGVTVTVPAGVAAVCTDLTLGGNTHTANVTLVLADATSSLAASGNVLVGRANASNIITAINVGAGTFSAGSLTLGNTSATNGSSRKTDLLISTGSATITGDLTTYANAARITFSGAGTLTLGGSFTWTTSAPTFTPATGTVNYNGAGAQTVQAYAYYNLILSGSDAKSLVTGTSVTSRLAIAPTGSAYASVANGANLSVNILSLGGVGASNGTWGSASGGSGASHTSDTYFGTTTSGILTVAVDSPTACDILTFGPGAVINQSARTIVWKVPPGTNLATLAPAYTLSPTGATCPQPNPGIPTPDLSTGAVHYIVTAQDTITQKDYTVTVEFSPMPVWSGLTCWYDASDGVTTNGSGQVTAWNDMSGNGHHASPSGTPVLAPNQLNSKPAVQLRGNYLNCAGTFFSKEQYVVVRSPNAWWSGYGAFLGRATGRNSSYMLDPNGNAYTGFWADQSPDGVSKNGAAVTRGTDGNHIYSLGPITNGTSAIQNYMILKIVVNNNDTSAASYQIARADGNTLPCDIAEIISYDTTLSAGDEAAVGSYLADKYAITSAYPLIHVPVAPTALVAEPLLHSIRLTWTAPWSATDYQVYRGTASGVYDPTPIATTTGGATIFTDMGGALVDGTTYYYVVRAVNAIGEGAASNEAFAAPTSGKVNQTITFGPLATKTYGDAPFALTATASSLLPVSYASSDELVASISGSTVTIHKAGTVTITASQDGDTAFNPAPPVDQSLTVSKADQTITFTAGLKLVKGSNTVPFSDPATSSGGSGNPVTYTSSDEGVATVDSSGLVTIVGVGTTEIRADQLGDADHYNAAPQVAQTLVVIATTLPVQDGLACWYDAGQGITEDGSGVASWGDSSTLGHLATRASGTPTLVANDINGKPAVHLRGSATFFNCAGGMFTKEQYLIVRSPNATWNGSGSFLGRKSDDFLSVRASSYNMASGTDGFWQDHFPQAVSKNGIPVAANNVSGSAFHLAPITDYMLLKITVDSGASAANLAQYPFYQIGKNETLGTMDFDVAEIIGYDRMLTTAEETALNTYLTNKYWGATDPYSAWLSGFTFAPGADTTPTGDPDGDGMSNQAEYAFGLDPTKGSSVNPISVPLDSATATFTYTRNANSGLDYTVEYSTNLSVWDTAAYTEEIGTPDANGLQSVTVTVTNPPVNGRLFVRVQAQ